MGGGSYGPNAKSDAFQLYAGKIAHADLSSPIVESGAFFGRKSPSFSETSSGLPGSARYNSSHFGDGGGIKLGSLNLDCNDEFKKKF